jgi:hypothetical protein
MGVFSKTQKRPLYVATISGRFKARNYGSGVWIRMILESFLEPTKLRAIPKGSTEDF